jgi:hypothetical protein
LTSSISHASDTSNYLRLINHILYKADVIPNLSDAKEQSILEDTNILMKLFCIISLDYTLMTEDQRDQVHKIAVIAQPFIEETERSYTNEILRTFLFVDIEQSNAKLFKARLIKLIGEIDS